MEFDVVGVEVVALLGNCVAAVDVSYALTFFFLAAVVAGWLVVSQYLKVYVLFGCFGGGVRR